MTINELDYSYRKQVDSLTSNSLSSKRSVDRYFTIEAMLALRRTLGFPFHQRMYDQTLYQLGLLFANLTVALVDGESRCVFALATELMKENRSPGECASRSSKKWAIPRKFFWKSISSSDGWRRFRLKGSGTRSILPCALARIETKTEICLG